MLTTQKTALVTGASDGIGRAVAQALAQAGWYVLIHGRDEARLHATQMALRTATGNQNIDWVKADFAVLSDVADLSRYLVDNYERLDVLIHNAGTFEPMRVETTHGYERTLAVNHIAPKPITSSGCMANRVAGLGSMKRWCSA